MVDQLASIEPLQTEGIRRLGKEDPLLLALICSENFLPPTQLIYSLQALKDYDNKDKLYSILKPLLNHYSNLVITTTIDLLFENTDESA
jgi:hypothetical protein